MIEEGDKRSRTIMITRRSSSIINSESNTSTYSYRCFFLLMLSTDNNVVSVVVLVNKEDGVSRLLLGALHIRNDCGGEEK